MPLYFFDLKDGTRLVDPSGTECRDDEAAELKGKQLAVEVGIGEPESHSQRYVAVINSEGQEIKKVPITRS
jgi:hypothetical protein